MEDNTDYQALELWLSDEIINKMEKENDKL